MAKRFSSIGPPQIAALWALSLGAYLLARLFLQAWFGLPVQGGGLFSLVAVLIAASWALVEEPALAPGGAGLLLKMWLGLALLVFGEACLYYFVDGKERLASLAIACFAGGLLCLMPAARRGRALKLLLLVLALSLATFWAFTWRATMDLVAGPPLGQRAPMAVWILGSLVFLCALALSHQVEAPRHPELPWGWRKEVLGLLAVLALGAALRFPQLGAVPDGIWYDELNLSQATENKVLRDGQAPLYVSEQVENPGAYLWVGAAVYKVFGTGILPYRYLAAFFGLLALVPFWALARLWFGPRWALAAAALFGVMRWTLIPQRIGFMSGFALFWMLAAFWAFWSARLRPRRAWRWALAGALAGCNLHTYTPGRLVLVVLAAFVLIEFFFERGWTKLPGSLGPAAWMALGFLVTAGPMLWFIAAHWDIYALRSGQVSIFADAAKSGQSVSSELWTSLSKHLLMFHLRGDFNARHNLHFYPHVDLLTASALVVGLPYALGRFFKDARGRFLGLWFVVMLCAGIFTLAVEAPQGHRTILAAPVLALAVLWAWRDLVAPVGRAFGGGWPRAGLAAGLVLLLSAAAFNAHEVFDLWGHNSETWRSFSPFATAVGRRVAQSGSDVEVHLSRMKHEYLFHGFESEAFARYFLRDQGRQPQSLQMGTILAGNPAPRAVLLVWGETDTDMTAAFAGEFPEIPVERPSNPYPVLGESSVLYLAAEVPWQRIPPRKSLRGEFFVARQGLP
jgi:4-amino-4-deoxy-L-arabinose transferase-like glycosyltransferase